MSAACSARRTTTRRLPGQRQRLTLGQRLEDRLAAARAPSRPTCDPATFALRVDEHEVRDTPTRPYAWAAFALGSVERARGTASPPAPATRSAGSSVAWSVVPVGTPTTSTPAICAPLARLTRRGTSAWQCGHQCARNTSAYGVPGGAAGLHGLPGEVDRLERRSGHPDGGVRGGRVEPGQARAVDRERRCRLELCRPTVLRRRAVAAASARSDDHDRDHRDERDDPEHGPHDPAARGGGAACDGRPGQGGRRQGVGGGASLAIRVLLSLSTLGPRGRRAPGSRRSLRTAPSRLDLDVGLGIRLRRRLGDPLQPQSTRSSMPISRNALNAMNASVTYPSSWNHGTVQGASTEHELLLAKKSHPFDEPVVQRDRGADHYERRARTTVPGGRAAGGRPAGSRPADTCRSAGTSRVGRARSSRSRSSRGFPAWRRSPRSTPTSGPTGRRRRPRRGRARAPAVETSAASASTSDDDHRRVREQREDREEGVGDVDVVHQDLRTTRARRRRQTRAGAVRGDPSIVAERCTIRFGLACGGSSSLQDSPSGWCSSTPRRPPHTPSAANTRPTTALASGWSSPAVRGDRIAGDRARRSAPAHQRHGARRRGARLRRRAVPAGRARAACSRTRARPRPISNRTRPRHGYAAEECRPLGLARVAACERWHHRRAGTTTARTG